MRVYYHFYPTCPYCHEPHDRGSSLEKIDNENLKCPSCGAHFCSRINLLSSEGFANTLDAVINKEGGAEKYLSKLPLVWGVRPNKVEEEYILWVNRTGRGKFLITWPWKNVKFIPLLVSEYLLNNPAKKVVVIGDISSDSSDEMEIIAPGIKEVFDNLIYLEEEESDKIDESIKKEMGNFDKKFVLEKEKVIHYEIHRIGTHNRAKDICDQSFTKCKNRLIREIKEDYGEESIRDVDEIRIKRGKTVKTLNKNGFIDIKLEEKEQWMGNLKYNKKWLWDVLLNSKKMKRLNRIISNIVLKESEEEKLDENNKRLFFVPSETSPGTIFNTVKKINPDLVVIANTDEFIEDVIYGGEKSSALFNFLKDCENSLVLMFSTDPGVRYLYRINRTEKYPGGDNITPHTWDSELLIERIKTELKNHESSYPNPASSRWEELLDGGRVPEVEYIVIDSMDSLDVFLDGVSSIPVDEDVKKDIKNYICDLKRSPLVVRGDYEKPEVFWRRSNRETVHYDYLMNLIHERTDDAKFKSLKKVIDKIYSTDSANTTNPLMKKITEKVGDLLKEEGSFVTVVVHGYDVKGTEKLLRETVFNEYMPQRLSVCSWRDLSQREMGIAYNPKHYVISTLPPPPSRVYPIYFSHVKKFVFIGSGNNIKKIETIVKNRLTETISRPIYLLSESDPAPELLKTILKSVEIGSNEVLQNISEEIFAEFDTQFKPRSDTDSRKTGGSYTCISSGEHAVLVIDINKRGMFIPAGVSLSIKEDHRIAEISLDNISSPRDLENKELLIDRSGIYKSFQSIFIQFMMDYGKGVKFRNGPYEWDGFQNLFKDAIMWILMLENAVKNYSYKKGIAREEAKKKIAEHLSRLDLTAKGSDYIRGWWLNYYESVTTEYGAYPLYKVEHPKSLDDVQKIYKGINDILPEMKLDLADAERSYIASTVIQKFRRSFLKGDRSEIDPSWRQLYTQFEKEIESKVKTLPVFKVDRAYDVEIIKEAEPFRVMDDYKEYIQTSSNEG